MDMAWNSICVVYCAQELDSAVLQILANVC